MRILPLLVPALAPILILAAPAAAQTSPAAARTTVQRYYQAIDRGQFRTAYALWGDGGRRSGQSYAGFVRGFAGTSSSRVVAGPARDQEGAAGSVFITVPVDVYASLKSGRRQHFRGSYTLRRVNDVDGATPAQRTWHIESAKLRRV